MIHLFLTIVVKTKAFTLSSLSRGRACGEFFDVCHITPEPKKDLPVRCPLWVRAQFED